MTLIKCEKMYAPNRKIWAVVAVDEKSELPKGANALKVYVPGSLALVINDGDIYALNSTGEWILQENIVLAL